MVKKFIIAIALYTALLVAGCTWAFGQTILKTPTNISYYKFGSGPDVLVYMHGYNEYPLSSKFYTTFKPSVESKTTIYIPYITNSGWEKPWNNTFIGTDFLNWVDSQHPAPQRIFVTTYSAGADPGYIYAANRITAFASVAGSDGNYHGMMSWRTKNIPVWAFIGTNDTSENSRAKCEQTWISWYYYGGNVNNPPITTLRNNAPTYVNGGHSAVDDYAYNPANGLWAWFDSIGTPTPPINPVIKDNVKISYFVKSENTLYVETEGGEILKFKPDD